MNRSIRTSVPTGIATTLLRSYGRNRFFLELMAGFFTIIVKYCTYGMGARKNKAEREGDDAAAGEAADYRFAVTLIFPGFTVLLTARSQDKNG